MSSKEYWKKRSVRRMYEAMEAAEQSADEIARIYLKSSGYVSHKANEIFEKFRLRFHLSEAEARRLLAKVRDRASLDQLLQALQNSDIRNREELLAELESAAYGARLDRLRQLQDELDLVMTSIYRQEKQLSTAFYRGLARETYYKSMFDIQQRVGVSFDFSHISAKQIDQVLSMDWSGKNYSARIWKNTKTLAAELKEELLINLLTGRTNREAAAIISNKFASGASQARRLVRTESNFISGEINAAAYQEAGIEEYRYLATLDLRTSEICRSLDGKIFPVSQRQVGENYPPMHPWCRSTTVAVIDRKYIADMTRDALDPSTGRHVKVPASMTYPEWYEKFVKGKPEAELEERKTKNRSADRRQHQQYRELLGENVPERLDDFQNMKYNEPEKWEFVKLDYKRRNELVNNPALQLPDAERAVLPEGKFTKYLLGGNNEKGLAKGRAFTSRLGYNLDNWESLRDELQTGALKYPAVMKGYSAYGTKYEQKMVLYGKKGTPANVVVGWLQRLDGTVSMTSAYIKEV